MIPAPRSTFSSLLRLVEAIGLLALIRDAPHAVAREREQMAQLLKVDAGHTIPLERPRETAVG
jgi:hypothetical protein